MRNLLVVCLTVALLLCAAPLAALSETASEQESPERTFDGKRMATIEMVASPSEIFYFFDTQLGIPIASFDLYPTISDAMFALRTGKADTILSMDAAASYVAKQDPTLYTYMDPRLEGFNQISLSMLVLKRNEALGKDIDRAIAHLTETGELADMTKRMFSGDVQEPRSVAEPTGEKMYVGVTGDIPPIDYVDAAGNPVGFNVSLMTAIGAYLGREVEFVQTNKGGIVIALITGKIDVVFWQEQALAPEIQEMVGQLSDNLYVTTPYLSLDVTAIELK